MKYALVAVIITMLFALQSALAAESTLEIADDLIDAPELAHSLPKDLKAPKDPVVEVKDEVIAEESADEGLVSESTESVATSEIPPALDGMETLKDDSTLAPELNERQPAAAEETMVAEAPGTIDFDMATIDMIPDELPAPKTNFSEIAKSK